MEGKAEIKSFIEEYNKKERWTSEKRQENQRMILEGSRYK